MLLTRLPLVLVLALLGCQATEPPSAGTAAATAAVVAWPPNPPPFAVVQYCAAHPLPQVLWLHVHENETTALATAQAALAEYGAGCVLSLQHGNGRNVVWHSHGQRLEFDPNRIFTARGRQATLRRHGNGSVAAQQHLAEVAEAFLSRYVRGRQLLVAVHNNQAQGISVHSFAAGGALAVDAARVAIQPQQSGDDFFYVTNERAWVFLRDRGFNVVLQDNVRVRDDGSLSVYAAQQGVDYINVEAAYGHMAQQQAMLAAVFDYIRARQLD